MLAFSACMRSHGEPSFPDPNASGVIQGSDINTGSPQFQRASSHCRKDLPGRGQPPSPAQQARDQAQALRFSACMRAHGLKDFPDPQFTSGGGVALRIRVGSGSNLDPNSPLFRAAQKACQGDLPGKFGQATPVTAG